MSSRGPELADFVGGFPGPAATQFRGGAIKVVAALVYRDGLLIEWLVGPVPDLSWISDVDEDSPERQAYLDHFHDQPGMIERLRASRRLGIFWDDASLVDDLGGEYITSRSESESRDGRTHRGRMAFSPRPPDAARELTLRVHDLVITIELKAQETSRT